MKPIENIIIFLVLITGITSCVDEYMPNVDKYEHVLVVDGLLTNGADPVLVRLSYSSPITSREILPASGAELYITDEYQLETQLTEMEPGNYIVTDSTFRGEIGNSYQLHIQLPNGQNYISDICSLSAPSPIDSIYGINESHENINSNIDLSGVQFYIDNHSLNSNDTSYYLWRLTQTYKYEAAFTLDYTWEGEFIPYPNPDSLRTCWSTTPVSDIFIFTTKYYDSPEIVKFPLNYVSTESKRLSIRYSLLVKQLSISKEAFDFYNVLKEQNIEQGNLYSEQPIQVRGNVDNVNDHEEPVLGYFIVAGVSKKRIYVDRPVLPFYYFECQPDFESMAYLSYYHPRTWPVYITQTEGGGKAMAPRITCFDCRKEHGSLTPPDFWVSK